LLEQWKLPPNAKVVLSPRLLRSLYNIDTIATAAREVCAAFPNVYFLFAFLRDAVDKDYENRVRATVEADPFTSERVRFIGEIPHEEMADYYRLADVIVSIPSHDGTALSVLESMAAYRITIPTTSSRAKPCLPLTQTTALSWQQLWSSFCAIRNLPHV
jgi:1,2-diacylglycerol 3-alpha-glucosyltransferase